MNLLIHVKLVLFKCHLGECRCLMSMVGQRPYEAVLSTNARTQRPGNVESHVMETELNLLLDNVVVVE